MKADNNQALREHLIYLLEGGGAHAKFEDVIKDFPAKLRGQIVPSVPYTAWMVLEHMRIAQWDILEFSRHRKYSAPKWPDEYWPKSEAPSSAGAWTASIKQFQEDMKEMRVLVSDPKIDLYARIPWGDGQTILRESLLVADHNAYHLGQLVTLRRALGAWKE